MLGEGNQMVMLPIRQSRLCLLIGSRQLLESFQMNQLALALLEALRDFDSVKSFIHVGSVRELGKQL